MEWFALAIPIIGIVVAYILYPHKIVWVEILLPILPCIGFIGIIKCTTEIALTSDSERWGSYVVSSRYYEDWNEYISQTCTDTDSKGNTTTYDCSYIEYHHAYWEVTDSLGKIYNVSEDMYEYIKTRFGNNTFHDMHRWSYTNDGDMYETEYPNNDKVMVNWFTIHKYENRVKAARSVFRFPKVDDTSMLYVWPELDDNINDPAILGNAPDKEIADFKLQHYNAVNGSRKQVRVWILLFNDQPRSIAFDQESFWQGGNKNEVVICIGTDAKYDVQWCHCFCWSPDGNTSNDVMKINIRDYVEKQKPLKLLDTVSYSCDKIDELFERKHFKEFSYLTVEMPIGATIACYIMTLALTVGVCYFVVNNEYDNDGKNVGDIIDDIRRNF